MPLSRRALSPYFLVALLVLLAFVSFRIAQVFLNYLLTSLFLAYLSHPMYLWFKERLRSHIAAGLASVVVIAGLIIAPLALLLVRLTRELSSVLAGLDVASMREQFDKLSAAFYEFFGLEPSSDAAAGEGLLEIVVPSLNNFLSSAATALFGAIFEGFIGVFILLYVLYYALIDGPRWLQAASDMLPMPSGHRRLLFYEVGNVIKAVMYGSVLTAVIQAALAAMGFALFGVSNVALWGSITFILALLPIVGPPLVWLPWGLVLILQGETFNGVGLLIYGAIMVSTLDNFIRPKLIGDRAHVHPVIVLIGVLGGLVVFGFSGFILGPVILAMFITIADLYRKEFTRPSEVPLDEIAKPGQPGSPPA